MCDNALKTDIQQTLGKNKEDASMQNMLGKTIQNS